MRRATGMLVAILVALAWAAGPVAAQQKQPNIVIIWETTSGSPMSAPTRTA